MDKPVDNWTSLPPTVRSGGLPPAARLACFPLALASRSDRVAVVDIVSDRSSGERLMDMGLAPGVEIGVLQNDGRNPLLLRIGGTRLALGADLARRVMVVPVGGIS